MFTERISQLMKYCPNFIGIYPCDRLPVIRSNVSMIINTDISSGPGEHWIAVYVGRNTLYFFDSIGRVIDEFSNPFRDHIKTFSDNFIVKDESKLLQNPFSNTCGYWCIFYIFCKTCRVDRPFSYFYDDLEYNEIMLQHIFEYLEFI